MSRTERFFVTAFVLYALVALVTFGHAWHEIPGNEEAKAIGALGCSIGWPLYWSVHAWGG